MKKHSRPICPILAVTLIFSFASPWLSAQAAETGSIKGLVVNDQRTPVVGACVLLCRQDNGTPLAQGVAQTLTEVMLSDSQALDLAYSVTDREGRFEFQAVPPGEYRLVAQSWKDAKPIEGLLEVNSAEIVLHGVADHVKVVPETLSPPVTIGPLGTGVLRISEDIPNDETLLVISTAPLRADPILGFAGWGGPFLQQMIGGNRMPHGKTVVRGLPPGTVHVAAFAADNMPGFGAALAEIKPHSTTAVHIPLVASWSDGHHQPPERLAGLCEEVRSLVNEKNMSVQDVLERHGIRLVQRGSWQAYQEMVQYLSRDIELPTGSKVSFADFMAADRYVKLQAYVEQRRRAAQRNWEIREAEKHLPEDAASGGYAESFLALYRELGQRYPCFELKDIDWPAVGEELLPRAAEVTTDEQFGLLCLELVARLEDSHAFVGRGTIAPPTPPFPRWDPGLACLIDDRGRPVVYYIDKDGPAEAKGVKVGMTVLSVDGEPADEVMQTRMEQANRYQGFSSRRYLRYQAARWFLRQAERGATVSLEMQSIDGQTHRFDLPATFGVRYLPRLPLPIARVSDSAGVSWTMLDDDIGYIYVRRIRGDLIERLDRAVEALKAAKGLIVDVRGNSGGGFDANRSHRNFASDDDQEPERPRFAGPMALLIDARCISAGEGWASWFIAQGRARVFGEATAGASARKTDYRLKNELYQVTFPVKAYTGFLDRPIERRGLEPDVPVMQNAADLAAGRDTVLQKAKEYLAGGE